jgi:tetratricopeptide (TPR) repeat protein
MADIVCGNPACNKIGPRCCSGCLKEGYCGPLCQKNDWKIHKILCTFIKNDHKLLSYKEVEASISTLREKAKLKKGTRSEIRILEYCLSFAERQYGDWIIGKSYRERRDCSKIDNWTCEIDCIEFLCFQIGNAFMMSTNTIDDIDIRRDNYKQAIKFAEKSLFLLEPWRTQIDLEKRNRTDQLDRGMINNIYYKLSISETVLSDMHDCLNEYDKAEKYHDMAILHGGQVTVKSCRIQILYSAMRTRGQNLRYQATFDDSNVTLNKAKAVFEEAYIIVSEAYSLGNPMTLEAANLLISCLIELGEFYDAERYSRMCYECLTRPIDTESLDVADAAESLADVTYRLFLSEGLEGGDIVEAEMLARKSLRIKEATFGPDNYMTCPIKIILSNLLQVRGDRNYERKALLEECLTIYLKRCGGDAHVVASMNEDLANLHHKISDSLPPGDYGTEQFRIALAYINEAIRISSKTYGPNHSKTLKYKAWK